MIHRFAAESVATAATFTPDGAISIAIRGCLEISAMMIKREVRQEDK